MGQVDNTCLAEAGGWLTQGLWQVGRFVSVKHINQIYVCVCFCFQCDSYLQKKRKRWDHQSLVGVISCVCVWERERNAILTDPKTNHTCHGQAAPGEIFTKHQQQSNLSVQCPIHTCEEKNKRWDQQSYWASYRVCERNTISIPTDPITNHACCVQAVPGRMCIKRQQRSGIRSRVICQHQLPPTVHPSMQWRRWWTNSFSAQWVWCKKGPGQWQHFWDVRGGFWQGVTERGLGWTWGRSGSIPHRPSLKWIG